MSGEGTYAPRSPDLSSFYSAGPTPPAEQQAQTQQWVPLSQSQPPSQFSPQQPHKLPPSSTYFSGQPGADQSSHHYQPQPQPPHQPSQHQLSTPPQALAQTVRLSKNIGDITNQPPLNTTFSGAAYPPQSQAYSPYISQSIAPASQPASASSYTAPSPQSYQSRSWYGSNNYQYHPQKPIQQQQHQPPLHAPRYSSSAFAAPTGGFPQGLDGVISPPDHNDTNSSINFSNNSSTMPPKRTAAARPPPPTIEPSPVKTKFPTARIKRIMQADEEVGKVAQQTPIAVGKALELFMVQMVTKSADLAREKNSKRVSAQMLKQVVEADEQWDFLREIVSRVETTEEKKGGPSKTKGAAETESEEEAAEAVPEKKKRAGRRKKVA
ncbi:putative DNA polymerase epsilon subunit C [Triangularia verruculosa]|uniref:NCT transcriptional regulatory complex subunit A n=1 Tax=Triangularia verruculosa TaxID=2587418 RepID=A0AAN6XF86_9PEZI|nr:putative DNA polymerase epsilon subunit C [Triangularia verruculosa]